MTFKEIFEMKRKMATVPSHVLAQYEKIDVPESMWMKCDNCKNIIYRKGVEERFGACPSCGKLFRLTAKERINITCDKGSFVSLNNQEEVKNPLQFPGYEKKLESNRVKSGISEAVVTGTCQIGGNSAVICVMDSTFMMGSMGSIVGERITSAVEYATEQKLPVIIFTASGGARMQEGTVSLMQMAKTSAAVMKHSEAGLLTITVLTDPTTGGVTASFAMLGDIIIAEKGAMIGFAGKRVIEQTIKEQLPDNFQKAEFVAKCGFVDLIAERSDLKKLLTDLLVIHGQGGDYAWR